MKEKGITMKFKSRFTSWAAMLTVTLTALLVPTQTAQAVTFYIVDDDASSGTCNNLVATYPDMQTAVTDAITYHVHTILVCPGSYNNFTVTGAIGLVIKAAVPKSYPIINSPSLSFGNIIFVQPSVSGVPSTGVVIDGLKLDGANFADTLTGNAVGINFYNSSGIVRNSIITGLRDWPNNTGSYGTGMWVHDNNADGKLSVVTVTVNNITDIGSQAILVDGPAKVVISKTSIVGNFSGGGNVSFAGVAFLGGSTGSVISSSISEVSLGVRILGGSVITVSGNTISNASYGVKIDATCTLPTYKTANANKILKNTFTGISTNGVHLHSDASSDTCTPHADNNIISGNRFTGTPGATKGVQLLKTNGAVNAASANHNYVTNNMIFGFTGGVDIGAPFNMVTNPVVSGNTFIP